MSNAFDKALINREKNRQQLAEVLDQKYDTERRNQAIFRLGFTAAVLCVAAYAFQYGSLEPPDWGSLADYGKKEKVLAQVQKQISSGDQMMIGTQPRKTLAGTRIRTKGGAAFFDKELVPLNLTGEVRKAKKIPTFGAPAFEYARIPAGKEAERLLAKRGKKPPVKARSGVYRPATQAEAERNSVKKRARKAAPDAGLYQRVSQPPAWLAADSPKFPASPAKGN